MPDHQLLFPIGSHELGPRGGDQRFVVFGVPGRQRPAPSLQVHVQTLLGLLDQLAVGVERLVFVEGSSVDSTTAALIESMLAAMGPEDGLVRFQIPAEAIKLVRSQGLHRFVESGIDRTSLVAFRPPEVLRVASLVAALTTPPVVEWVDPAGLLAAHGGLVQTYPSGRLHT